MLLTREIIHKAVELEQLLDERLTELAGEYDPIEECLIRQTMNSIFEMLTDPDLSDLAYVQALTQWQVFV